MANWDKVESEGNVEDRRGSGLSSPVGLGTIGTIIILGIVLFTGNGDLSSVSGLLEQLQQQSTTQTTPSGEFEDTKKYKEFSSKVIGSTNQVWKKEFSEEKLQYKEPKLVLFRGSTNSECGGADSRVGPHYCPNDQTIYLDETFFEQLRTKFGAQGGQVAEAYVMAHEVGHHVQNITGILNKVNMRDNSSSVKVELLADCYAGVWAGIAKQEGVINESEISQAIDAASAVGDDRIQKSTTGRVNPETWTHGSSAQRKQSFMQGYKGLDNNVCNSIIE
jgi:uncharacterized protein